MNLRNTTRKYGTLAKHFHWWMVLIFVVIFTLGIIMVDMPAPDKFQWYGWHKSLGVIVLALGLSRLYWRLTNVQPKLPKNTPAYERILGRTVHLSMYGFMIAVPLVGWLMSNTAGHGVSVFGLDMPWLMAENKPQAKVFNTLHHWGAYIFLGFIGLHVLAAFVHHYWHKDNTLNRMLPKKLWQHTTK